MVVTKVKKTTGSKKPVGRPPKALPAGGKKIPKALPKKVPKALPKKVPKVKKVAPLDVSEHYIIQIDDILISEDESSKKIRDLNQYYKVDTIREAARRHGLDTTKVKLAIIKDLVKFAAENKSRPQKTLKPKVKPSPNVKKGTTLVKAKVTKAKPKSRTGTKVPKSTTGRMYYIFVKDAGSIIKTVFDQIVETIDSAPDVELVFSYDNTTSDNYIKITETIPDGIQKMADSLGKHDIDEFDPHSAVFGFRALTAEAMMPIYEIFDGSFGRDHEIEEPEYDVTVYRVFEPELMYYILVKDNDLISKEMFDEIVETAKASADVKLVFVKNHSESDVSHPNISVGVQHEVQLMIDALDEHGYEQFGTLFGFYSKRAEAMTPIFDIFKEDFYMSKGTKEPPKDLFSGYQISIYEASEKKVKPKSIKTGPKEKVKGKNVKTKVVTKPKITSGTKVPSGRMHYILVEDNDLVSEEMFDEIVKTAASTPDIELVFVQNNSESDVSHPNIADAAGDGAQKMIEALNRHEYNEFGTLFGFRACRVEAMGPIFDIFDRDFDMTQGTREPGYQISIYNVSKEKAKSKPPPRGGKTKIPKSDPSNERTSIEKILAGMHDVRSMYSPDYIIIGNYALFEAENVNRGELHVNVDIVKEILKTISPGRGGSELEVAFVDSYRDVEYLEQLELKFNLPRHEDLSKDIAKLIKKKNPNSAMDLKVKKAFDVIRSSETIDIGDFKSEIICFRNTSRSMMNVMNIMNILAGKIDSLATAPTAMHTFDVYEWEDEGDIQGASLRHNVLFLAYNR